MLRVMLLGVLVASAAACSKSGGDAPAAAVGAPAGKVVAVTGKAEATREGKTRALTVGADVFADDEIATSVDSSVAIDLFHNNARWSVEAGKRAKLRESIAWTLAKQDQPAKPVEHATSSAGREGERQGATTTTTTTTATTGGAPPVPEAEPAAMSSRADEQPTPKKVERGRDRRAGDGALDGIGVSGGGATGGATMSHDLDSADQKESEGARAEEKKTVRTPPPPPKPSAPPPTIEKLVLDQRANLAKCPDIVGELEVTIVVTNGKAVATLTGLGTAATKRCIADVLAKVPFPSVATATTVTLKL